MITTVDLSSNADGTFNSYDPYTTSASHVFTTIGTALVRFEAVTYDPTAGYGVYRDPAQPLVITADGVTATPLSITTTASTDTFNISSDDSGDTIITKTTAEGITTAVADEPTADILSLSIIGNATNVTIDFDNSDPLPTAGIFSDAANITLTGGRGTVSLVNTGTAALLGNDTIRYPATTQLFDDVNSFTILALAGTTTFTSLPLLSDVTVATGATLLVDGSQVLSSLTIEPGGTAREISPVTTLGATVLNIFTLTLDDTDAHGDAGGVLDLGNGDLITKGTSLTSIQTWLTAGYNDGSRDGVSTTEGINPAAIVSSEAANDPYGIQTLGNAIIGSGSGGLALTSFDGHSVASGDVVAALTYYGDANLDRQLNNADTNMIQSNSGFGSGWTSGDFNYDEVVDDQDAALAAGAATILDAPASQPTVEIHLNSNLSDAVIIPDPGAPANAELSGPIAVTATSNYQPANVPKWTVHVTQANGKAVKTDWFYIVQIHLPGNTGGNQFTVYATSKAVAGDYVVTVYGPDGQTQVMSLRAVGGE